MTSFEEWAAANPGKVKALGAIFIGVIGPLLVIWLTGWNPFAKPQLLVTDVQLNSFSTRTR